MISLNNKIENYCKFNFRMNFNYEEFDYNQIYEINEGFNDDINVSIYAKKEYSHKLMNKIRKILQDKNLQKEDQDNKINQVILEN